MVLVVFVVSRRFKRRLVSGLKELSTLLLMLHSLLLPLLLDPHLVLLDLFLKLLAILLDLFRILN